MTTGELISDIRNIITSGSNAIEFRIEDSQILFWCNEVRAMLIAQSLAKRNDINDTWVQTIFCFEMEQVDKSECCDIKTNCYILKSKLQLPNTIDTNRDNTILRVATPMGKIISKSNPFESRYASYNKYTKNRPGWFIRNNYLYIINEDILKWVDVDLLAEVPSDLSVFNNCSGVSCFNNSSEYPCSLKMANDITNIVIKTKATIYLQMPSDRSNDAENSSEPENKQINNKNT